MSKDVFTVFSEDGMHGATCLVDMEPDASGRYAYQVFHTTCGTFGWGRTLKEAMDHAEDSAREQFKYKSFEWIIKQLEKEIAALKRRATQ